MSDRSTQSPRFTLWQAVSAAVNLSIRAMEEVRALSRQPGPQGERGRDGATGKLQIVRAWTEKVHYEGDVVTRDGSTYQAIRDTGQAPPHEDWATLAVKGRDAAELTMRGVFDPDAVYTKLNAVMFDGSSWIAVKDNPGALPGDGWRQLASRGKRGEKGIPGERGERGYKGEAGAPGPAPVDMTWEGFTLVVSYSDGTTLAADATPMLQRFWNEAR